MEDAGSNIMWSIIIPTLSPNIMSVTKSKTMRWGGACSIHGRDEKCMQNFGQKT